MGNKRNRDNGDQIDEFGSYTGPTIILIIVVIAVVALILFYSSSPRIGLTSAAIFLLAVIGVAAAAQRFSS